MSKFFIKQNQINYNNINIIGEDVNHIKNVLRMKENDNIKICNLDNAQNYLCKIEEINKEYIKTKIIDKIQSNAEDTVYINIFQGIPKSDKMELIIQKSTEIGVKEITPVQLERCVSKIDKKSESKKIDRWQKIAEMAAKQSGRDIIPKVNNVIDLKNICNVISNYDIVLLAYENEENNSLKNEIDNLKKNINKSIKVGIIIGPEGGLEEKEVETLKQYGAKSITLGTRILRTETVALSLSSIIMYELGNLGGNL